MPRHDWDPDDEDWSETGDEDDDAQTVPCPECGAEIYDDLDHCPRCGHWLTDADSGRDRFPSRRVRIVAIVIIVIFVATLLASSIGRFR